MCQKIPVQKVILQGLSGPLFEDPSRGFLCFQHSGVLAEQERQSGKNEDRTSKKNKDNLCLAG